MFAVMDEKAETFENKEKAEMACGKSDYSSGRYG